MSFAHRDLLLLTAALPVLMIVLLILWGRRRRKVARALGDSRLIARLGGHELERVPLRRWALLVPAAIALGIAVAGPHWGIQTVEGESRSVNVVLALDVSKSMLARDVSPSRLERQRLIVRRLLRDLASERVGLVVFAGRAYILSPLTNDQSALQLFVDALDPGIVSQGGSSIAAAITLASDLARGPQGAGGDRAVVLITDGEAHESEASIVDAVQRAARQRVKVFTVGIGSERGAPVPELDPGTGAVVGYKVDPFGATVVSRMNPDLLRTIAAESGGQFYNLAGSGSTADLARELRRLERTPGITDGGLEPKDQTVWFIALALLLLGLDFLLTRRRKRAPSARQFQIPPAAAALLALLFATGFGIGELERGNRYYREGKYAQAVREYQAALQDGNDSPELQYNLGTALLRLGRHVEAERHLRIALRDLPADHKQRAYYNLGNRYLEEARSNAEAQNVTQLLDSAIEAYKQALRLQPGDMDAKWNLELALREKDEQQQQSSSGGRNERQPQTEDEQQQSQVGGGGAGASPSQSPAGQGQQRGQNLEQRPMSQEQADRILSAVEQDERELTREKLRKGERRTAVARDW